MRRKTTADYEPPAYKVGKGRPPLKSRWTKGQSGNPKGRPRGSKNLDTIVMEIMSKKIRYTENGKTRTTTTREAIFTVMAQQALKGDLKSADYLLARDAEIAKKTPPAYRRSDELIDPKERDRRAVEAYLTLVRND
jgi:hypothetical protein